MELIWVARRTPSFNTENEHLIHVPTYQTIYSTLACTEPSPQIGIEHFSFPTPSSAPQTITPSSLEQWKLMLRSRMRYSNLANRNQNPINVNEKKKKCMLMTGGDLEHTKMNSKFSNRTRSSSGPRSESWILGFVFIHTTGRRASALRLEWQSAESKMLLLNSRPGWIMEKREEILLLPVMAMPRRPPRCHNANELDSACSSFKWVGDVGLIRNA